MAAIIDNPDKALVQMKKLVSKGNFEFAPRRKLHVTSNLAKLIVKLLSSNDFVSCGYDHNGSGDLVFVYIADDGIRYYIKFKFINNETTVKFISFHEAEF